MIMTGCLLSAAMLSFGQTTAQRDSFDLLSPVEVRAVRAGEKAPFAKSNLSKTEIAKRNLGQDIPFVLNLTPSVVVNSDAGTGIGYTGLRIRGTDATRINITLNGIPYNDAESQGTFFVNLPDFTSSVSSIQIQRGVGTSSNGTGAFGATVSLSTNEVNTQPYAEFNNAYGSFDTWKNTVKAGTGLIDDHFTVDARLSRISSSGYIDRASSDLQSFYLSGAYLNKGSAVRLNIFSGKEKTYQAWNGIPESLKESNRTYNSAGTDRPGAPYDNETDNYTQTHYQLFFDQKLNTYWQFNTALYLTRGKGYYENYKGNERLSKYGLADLVLGDTTISHTDLVRQKWLDNYFYGQILSLQYRKDRHEWVIGGGWSRYQGDHFGKVIWAKYGFDEGYRYYDNDAWKTDVNVYTKWQYQLTTVFSLFADLQYRRVQHRMNGFEENPALIIDRSFNFFNPKAGITYRKNGWQAFVSYAHAGKEPNRDDFQASLNNQPKKETLHDFEGGVEKRTSRFSAGINLYYMLYKDQLVQTGMINDVGAYTRINVPNSYRMGIELQGGVIISKWLNASANLTLSRNKIKAFNEFLDDYDADFEWIGQQSVQHRNTDIAFSPAVIAGGSINILPVKNLEISLLEKYVGRQYMDNTQNKERSLDDFFTQDVRVMYTLGGKRLGQWTLIGQVNNVFNRRYEPNGYTYSYVFDGNITADNFYMPMAGTNFMVGVNVRL